MSEEIKVTTQELAKLLGLHEFTIGKLYGPAYAGRKAEKYYSNKLYNLEWVAELISQRSGHIIEASELHDLVTHPEAVKVLAEQGSPRCAGAFRHWHHQGVGPRLVKVGAHTRYVRADLIAWAGQLAVRDKTNTRQSRLPPTPDQLAQSIKATSGAELTPEQASELITRKQAMHVLDELGKGRSTGTWARWAEMSIGPPAYYAGRNAYYRRSHVVEWAKQIPESREARQRRRGLPRHKAQKPQQIGPNADFQKMLGDEGGSLHFSLSSKAG